MAVNLPSVVYTERQKDHSEQIPQRKGNVTMNVTSHLSCWVLFLSWIKIQIYQKYLQFIRNFLIWTHPLDLNSFCSNDLVRYVRRKRFHPSLHCTEAIQNNLFSGGNNIVYCMSYKKLLHVTEDENLDILTRETAKAMAWWQGLALLCNVIRNTNSSIRPIDGPHILLEQNWSL